MDNSNTNIANQKDQEAEQLRKDEAFNKDNPKVQGALEDAARGLENDAAALREEDAREAAETESEET